MIVMRTKFTFLVILSSLVIMSNSCILEKVEDFKESVKRSDVILKVTAISLHGDDASEHHDAKFHVIGNHTGKSGEFQINDVISLGKFGDNPPCFPIKVGDRYMVFMARKEGEARFSLKYNPVLLTDDNMVLLDDIIAENDFMRKDATDVWKGKLRLRREVSKATKKQRKQATASNTSKRQSKQKNKSKLKRKPKRQNVSARPRLNKRSGRKGPPSESSKEPRKVRTTLKSPTKGQNLTTTSENIKQKKRPVGSGPTKRPSQNKPISSLGRPARDEEPTKPPRRGGGGGGGGRTRRPPRERSSRRPGRRPRRTTTPRTRRPGRGRGGGRTRRPGRGRGRTTTPEITTTPTTTTQPTTTTTTTEATTTTTTTTAAPTTTTAPTLAPQPNRPNVVRTNIVTRPGANGPLLALGQSLFGCPTFDGVIQIFSSYQGNFHGMAKFEGLSQRLQGGWLLRVTFNVPLRTLNAYTVDMYSCSSTGRQFCLVPKEYAENINSGASLIVSFNAEKMFKRPITSVRGDAQLLGVCRSPANEGRRFRDLIPPIQSVDEKNGQTGENGQGGQGQTTKAPTTTPFIRPTAVVITSPQDSRCSSFAPNGHAVEDYGPTSPQWQELEGSNVDYVEVLHKSILFYEAQRSGKLPDDNRIPWRGDSDLQDGCPIGRDLTGGWYNSGGNVKTTSLIAFSTTMLAWGAIDYSNAYESAGELENVVGQIRWAADYLMKCHVGPDELVVQIGDYMSASRGWSRPEESNPVTRTVYKASKTKPAGDVAAEVAAALAAVSMLLESVDPEYSAECLRHARELYRFAKENPEHYMFNPVSRVFWYSSKHGSHDERSWAAAWLNKATGEEEYLSDAESVYNMIVYNEASRYHFSWNQKANGIAALLALQSGQPVKYARSLQQFLDWTQNRARRTPQGLVHLSFKYPNMFAANSAFISLKAVDVLRKSPLTKNATRFARQQIRLLIGGEEQGYIVGVGENAPQRPHHRGSTCPGQPQVCNRSVIRRKEPNPNVLYGALVTGPSRTGRFTDRASNAFYNSVGIDINAGFQSLAAALLDLQLKAAG